MSKNYIEKVIDEKVPFEPDYSKIKDQVNINAKNKNKKRWVWPSLSLGLISIVVIITIIVSLSLKSNPNPTFNYDGVHFNNYTNNGSGNGEPSPPPPMVAYSIDIEEDHYDYNEEFIINYTIKGIGGNEVVDRNDLNIKIVSDKFEFLSPTEYHFDLETDVSIYGNVLSFGEEYEDSIYPIEMELKVKAKEQSEAIDSILFSLEFPLKNSFKEVLKNGYDKGESYKYMLDEFTKDFEWIHSLYYVNDELGTLLVDESKKFVYSSKDKKEVIVQPRTEIMYRSLNRLYERNLISKNDYMKRIMEYFINKRSYFCCKIKEHIVHEYTIQDKYYIEDEYIIDSYQYYSKNFRINFDLIVDSDFLWELYDGDQKDRIEAIKYLLKTAYEQGKINLEEYNNEIAILDEKGVFKDNDWQEYIGRQWRITLDKCNSVLVPFEDYKEYYFDMYIEI